MKSTDIQAVKYLNDEVSALYMGSILIYKKDDEPNYILAGSFTEPGEYNITVDSELLWGSYLSYITVPIELNDDLTFNMEINNLTTCHNMFYSSASKLKEITKFPESDHVTEMDRMFASTQLVNFTYRLKTSSCTTFLSMFEGCKSLEMVNLHFDTGNVTNMIEMFKNCISLEYAELYFNTSYLTKFKGLFYVCDKL